jgi:hypothetical protein
VNSTAVTFLGVIAAAIAVMALIQVGVIVFAVRFARRFEVLVARVERDVQPAIERLTTMSGEAARAASIAAAQVERVDRTMDVLSRRAEETALRVQRLVGVPEREAAALVSGVRAAIGSLRDHRREARAARRAGAIADDEDALFIG